jgi:hypothetical protein
VGELFCPETGAEAGGGYSQPPDSSIGQPESSEAFLSWLDNRRGASVSTHKQALSALLFLYKEVLGQQLP